MMAALYAGQDPKTVAFTFGCCQPYIYKLYARMGLKKEYVSQKEFKAVLAQREKHNNVP